MLDLAPATEALKGVVAGVGDDQLAAATPCTRMNVGGVLKHVDDFTRAFIAAAAKTPMERAEGEDAHRLRDGWRQHLPQQLDAMTQAWRDEAAWTGMTRAGGLELPADVVGVIGLDEVIVHGWDLAVSTGQTYACPEHLVLAARGFVQGAVARNPNGSEGLFGPPVAVPDDAPPMSRLLGLTGRDPGWSAPATDG